jgi:hypothetical protein
VREIIYVEHKAGTYEDGVQICVHCGMILCNYTTGHWKSMDGTAPKGFREGPVYITGKNPIQYLVEMPRESYGEDDPYIRKIQKCVPNGVLR